MRGGVQVCAFLVKATWGQCGLSKEPVTKTTCTLRLPNTPFTKFDLLSLATLQVRWVKRNKDKELQRWLPHAFILCLSTTALTQAALEHCKAEEERSKWDMLASQLRRNSNMPPSGTATVDQQQQYATTAPQTASSVSLPTMLLPPQAGLQGLGVVPAAQPSPTMAGFAPPVSYMAGGGSSVQAPIYMHGMQPHAGSASAYQVGAAAAECASSQVPSVEGCIGSLMKTWTYGHCKSVDTDCLSAGWSNSACTSTRCWSRSWCLLGPPGTLPMRRIY
eukprot:1139245-Pelagomonas_calceolata.AAC.9